MDNFFGLRKSYILAGSAAAFGCILMVIFPSAAFLSAQKGISIWAGNVLPALFPFFICANFMSMVGITRVLPPSKFAFAMSVVSGYPMGAKIIGDMGENGYISKLESRRLISFCSTSGPAFMVGAVGAGMLGSAKAGIVIAIAHYGGAILNGLCYSHFIAKNSFSNPKVIGKALKKELSGGNSDGSKDVIETFAEAVLISFKSLGIILAYIVMFMFITDIIQLTGILNFTNSVLIKNMFKGMLEMTVGCSSIAFATDITMSIKIIACTFLISWGGLSVIGQTMSMLTGLSISFGYLVCVKLTHGIFAVVLAFALCSIVI